MPKKMLKTAFLLFVFLLVTAESSRAQEYLAMITELKGDVFVARASDGEFRPAVWGTQMFKDDQIKTSDEAEASIMYSNSTFVKLGPNNILTISSTDSELDTGSPSIAEADRDLIAYASDLTLHRAGQGEISALGGLRSGGTVAEIELLTPRNTKITNAHPSFSWRSDMGYESYTVRVLSNRGLVWSGETQVNQINYPEDAPSLSPEVQYLWQVEGEEMLDVVKSDLVTFQILSEEAARSLASDEERTRTLFSDTPEGSSYLFVLGSLYIREGLLDSAIATFVRLAELHPDAVLPQEILGRLYSDIGLKDNAITALQRALDLGQQK